MAGGVCACARARVLSRWPEMGWVGVGRRPLARGSARVGTDSLSSWNLPLFAQVALMVMGRWRAGRELRLLVRLKAQVWNSGYSGKHLEWKARDLRFSLAQLGGPWSVIAPLWDSVSTSEKQEG